MKKPTTLWYLMVSGLLANLLVISGTVQAGMSKNEDFFWQNGLRQTHFGDREIIESEDIVSLQAPKRAEDAAIVPIQIKAHIPQTESRYIKTISLFIDRNPGPLAGRFHFTPKSGRAELALRVRVNAYTPMRAVAELNDGTLYMSKRFVKASGGCSAPPGADLEAAMTRMGRMKFKARDVVLNEPTLAQLNISHPNITGLQMDQVTRLYLPAHFVKEINVRFNGEIVMQAETDIAISQDPSFRFYFVPNAPGEISIEARDNKDMLFTDTYTVKPM